MLHVIKNLNEPWINLIKDDPVRPEIPVKQRVNLNSHVYVLHDALLVPEAVVCVKYQNTIPRQVSELTDNARIWTTAVFYTIWSYKPGAGQELIRQAKNYIEQNMPQINTFVTLSPQTEMARKFHLKNGAHIYRENETSVNYQYL